MKKFAANYLISASGTFLKNGIVVADEDGRAIEFIDTTDDLQEIAQLSFLNGILCPNFRFVKCRIDLNAFTGVNYIQSLALKLLANHSEVSMLHLIEAGVTIQEHFPEITIPELWNEMTASLIADGRFSKYDEAGLFLWIGVDLVNLHFTSKCRLKKIL
jgi:hypothetical protein